MLVRKALYRLKSYGAAFRAFLEENMDAMGYSPIHTNLDLWLRPEVKPYGFEYYEYILFYVDEMLCISHNLQKSMKRIQKYFSLKEYRIEPPDVYLGASLANMKL